MKFDIVMALFREVANKKTKPTVKVQRIAFRLIGLVEKRVRGTYAITLSVEELKTELDAPCFEESLGYALEIHRGWSRTSWTRLGALLVIINRGLIEDHDCLLTGVCNTTTDREAELGTYLQTLDAFLVALSDIAEVTVLTVDQVASIAGLGDDYSATWELMKLERVSYTGSGVLYLTEDLILVPACLR